jgi:hypothetical protein
VARVKREQRNGDDFVEGLEEGEPKRLKVPREQKPPTRTNPSGSKIGGWLSRWDEAAEATM